MEATSLDELLGRLNEQQMKVVQAGSGTFAVVGNPGSGKTSAIVARVARLVRDGVHPKWILAMTFTVKAADELTLRLGRLGIKGGRFGTIHSVALQILRDAESWIADLELDVKESMLLELKRILDGMRQKRKIPQTGVDYAQVQAYVDACKSRRLCWVYGDPWGVNDRTYRFLLDEAHAWKATTGLFPKELLDVYLALEEKRSSKGVYSFDDMLLWCWMSLSLRRDVRETWRKNWALVIVDEAQDSSLMQWDLSRYLAGLGTTCDDLSSLAGRPEADDGEHNLMAVGDVSQSLYSFRNARPEQFLEYASEKGTTLLTLPISYRAVPWLCQGASVILRGKPWHLGGDILPARAPLIFEGPPPLQEMRFQDPLAEMNWILDDATRRHEKGLPWRSMAVLSRLSMFLHFLETECARRGLAYELRASGSFWDSQDVQCLLGYLRVALQRDTVDYRWEARTINRPFRYIGKEALGAAAHVAAEKFSGSLCPLSCALLQMNLLAPRQERSVEEYTEIVREVRRKAGDGSHVHEILEHIIQRTNYQEEMRRDGVRAQEDANRALVLRMIKEVSRGFHTVENFLDYVDAVVQAMKSARARFRVPDSQGKADVVDALILSTIHRFKGLESHIIYLCDCTDVSLPCGWSDNLDEELRLFYVATTRAEDLCVYTWSGEPLMRSRFLKLTESHIDPEQLRAATDKAPGPQEDQDPDPDQDSDPDQSLDAIPSPSPSPCPGLNPPIKPDPFVF